MTAAEPWYSSATFWSAAGVIGGLIGVIAVVWVTLVVGFPRRRLFFGMPVVTPLLTPSPDVQDLEVRHRGTRLANPQVLEVRLVSRSRKDIRSGDFDSGVPLLLHVGAAIIEILRITSSPESLPAPKVTHDDTTLRVGPSLIGRRQKIAISVLVDGPRPHLDFKHQLIDVRVRPMGQDLPESVQRDLMKQQAPALVGVVAGVAAFMVAKATKGTMTLATLWIAVTLLLVACADMLWMNFTVIRAGLRRRRSSSGTRSRLSVGSYRSLRPSGFTMRERGRAADISLAAVGLIILIPLGIYLVHKLFFFDWPPLYEWQQAAASFAASTSGA